MKRTNTKLTALLLALLTALPVLSACGSGETAAETAAQTAAPSDGTAAVTEAAAEPVEETPDLDGFTLNLLKQTQDKIAWATETFAPAAEDGEIINDTIYRRNLTESERCNFALTEAENDSPVDLLKKQVLAGDTEYDLFLSSINKINVIANGEWLTDFHKVPGIDLSEEWWDQKMLRDLDTGSGMFFMNSDMILTVYDCTRIVYYNKSIASDLGLGDFYGMVDDGTWTIDAMFSAMEAAGRDLNGDGAMDYQDSFGLLYNNASVSIYSTAMGGSLVSSTGEIGVFSDRFADIYDKLLRQFNSGLTWHYNNDKYPGKTAREAIVSLFDNKQTLFFENCLSAAAQYLRNVENCDYGFLPVPKFNEGQAEYYSSITNSAPVLNIPVTVPEDRLENVGVILEVLSKASSETLIPAYYETCFAAKFTFDDESYRMITMIADTLRYDPGYIYDFGKISTTLNNAVLAGKAAFTSEMESIRPAVEADIAAAYGK